MSESEFAWRVITYALTFVLGKKANFNDIERHFGQFVTFCRRMRKHYQRLRSG